MITWIPLLLTAQERERAPENLPSTSASQAQLIMDVETQKEQQGSCENLPLNMDVDIPLEQHGIQEPSTLRCKHQTSMGKILHNTFWYSIWNW